MDFKVDFGVIQSIIPDVEAITAVVADYISKNPIKETDPTVAEWAKAKDKPEYTADEVGAIAKADLQSTINTALAQAKASGEFDGADGAPGKDGANGQPGAPGSPGKDGVTPTIGDNGNWYIGDTDTGKPSRGENGDTGPAGPDGTPGAAGTDGKSAYQYAVEGGYTGTEAEFAAKMAEEIPDKLPNPHPLTFTGAVEGSYDGSEAVTVEIPSGGDGLSAFEKIGTIDLSTMSEANSGVEYTVTDVTEIVLVWTGMTNTTTIPSSLLLGFSDDPPIYNTFAPKTGKAGQPLNGYTYIHVLEGVGLFFVVSSGATTNTNYALDTAGTEPYNLPPVKAKIQKLKICQPATQYYADAGIVEVYVR